MIPQPQPVQFANPEQLIMHSSIVLVITCVKSTAPPTPLKSMPQNRLKDLVESGTANNVSFLAAHSAAEAGAKLAVGEAGDEIVELDGGGLVGVALAELEIPRKVSIGRSLKGQNKRNTIENGMIGDGGGGANLEVSLPDD